MHAAVANEQPNEDVIELPGELHFDRHELEMGHLRTEVAATESLVPARSEMPTVSRILPGIVRRTRDSSGPMREWEFPNSIRRESRK